MYHQIVAAQVKKGMQDISNGRFEKVLAQFSSQIVFSFLGQHALGGEYNSVAEVRAWFQKIHGFFPDLRLEPTSICVSGWVWNTLVVTHFRVSASLPNSAQYNNQGVQVLRIRWGKIVEDRLFEDTEKLQQALGKIGQV
jgi:ketosteroid isomerase-like protein